MGSLLLKKKEKRSQQVLLYSSSQMELVYDILVPPLRHLPASLTSLQQTFIPSLYRLELFVKPFITNCASPLIPSTLKQNQLDTLVELDSFSSSIQYVLGAVRTTLLRLPHSKLLRKVAGPMGMIFPLLLEIFFIFLLMDCQSGPDMAAPSSFLSSYSLCLSLLLVLGPEKTILGGCASTRSQVSTSSFIYSNYSSGSSFLEESFINFNILSGYIRRWGNRVKIINNRSKRTGFTKENNGIAGGLLEKGPLTRVLRRAETWPIRWLLLPEDQEEKTFPFINQPNDGIFGMVCMVSIMLHVNYIGLHYYSLLMLDKESLASILLSQHKPTAPISLNTSNKGVLSYQREKGALIRQILNFHHERFSQKHHSLHGKTNRASHLQDFLMKHETQSESHIQGNYQAQLSQPCIYYNQYHSHHKSNINQAHTERQCVLSGQQFGVIDLFMKKEQNKGELSSSLQPINAQNGIKIQNKSFNESTMAVSKLQKSQVSPYRKIRKTQSHNTPQLPQISQDNNSESLFNLTQNESSISPVQQNQQKDQVKKVKIDLNHVKKTTPKRQTSKIQQKSKQDKVQHRLSDQLQEVEQYDELFDCSSGKKQDDRQQERQDIFNYLKDKFTKQKLGRSQKIMTKDVSKENLNENGSSGSSLNSFHSMIQKQKKQVHTGFQNINALIGQVIKTVNQNINIHESKKDDNNASLMLFPNASQPSTVQKLDERSNDKSELLRNLQDLAEYSISSELFKKIQPVETSKKQRQAKPYKQMTINLQDICDDEQVQGLFQQFAQDCSHDPSMPSFKIEPSVSHHNEPPIKRIQIHLQTLEPSDKQERSEVNLDQLSNYYSDDEIPHKNEHQSSHKNKRGPERQIKEDKLKEKPKVVLKSANNSQDSREKQIICDLKHDISQLKSKIQASFISQKSEQSTIKRKSHHKTVRIAIDLSGNTQLKDYVKDENNRSIAQQLGQLKHYVNNLQRKMLKDAGIHSEN